MYGGTIKYGIRLKSLTAFLMPNYYLLGISSSLHYFAMFASPKMAILNPDWTRIIDPINEIIPISMAICENSESFFEKFIESLPSNLSDTIQSICYVLHCSSNLLAIFCWQNIMTVRACFLSGKGFLNWWLYYNNWFQQNILFSISVVLRFMFIYYNVLLCLLLYYSYMIYGVDREIKNLVGQYNSILINFIRPIQINIRNHCSFRNYSFLYSEIRSYLIKDLWVLIENLA